MKKYILFLIPSLMMLTACSTGDAEKVADEFHKRFDNGEIDYIAENMIDKEATEDDIENFRAFLNEVRAYGKPTNREKETGFSKKINGGISTVRLRYTHEVDGETIYEGLVLVNRDDEYRILIVSMSPDRSVVDGFMKGY